MGDSKPSVDMTDEEIIKMVLREPAFFGHIIERYESKMRRYIRRLGVREPEDQDDVLQEIFMKVYKNINGFDVQLSFSSWLYRIAHNESISWYRKKSVRPEGHLVFDSEEILEFQETMLDSSEVSHDKQLNAQEVSRALESLDQKYRDVLVLRYFEHKEYEEISDILKIPIGSVGTLIHRGKNQLHQIINHDAVRV
ncbi:RNA polymerase sigma factor [Candidatus Kaiserbacteria bacterium]|nr:RNA polymerase sigma factor [Candidatus Kaiserbacteria bacterium]